MIDLTFFRQNGYQIVSKLLNPDVVTGVKTFLANEMATAMNEIGIKFKSYEDLATKIDQALAGDAKEQSHSGDQKLVLCGHYPLKTRLSERLWDVAKQASVRAVLEDVLETQTLSMHMPPAARFVLPLNKHAGVPAHQDISYNKHMQTFVTMWVPLVDIDDQCGGVAVFEGSQIMPEILDDYRRSTVWLRGVSTDKYNRVHCKMNSGDVLLLNQWIIHESQANVSPHPRLSIDYRFFRYGEKSAKHQLDMQRWTVVNPQN